MVDRTIRRAAAVVVALIAGVPALARAQVPNSAASGMYGTSAGMLANPYANPYLNPFLNPYMMQSNPGPQNTLLYMMAAQQMSGGIGSGQLSGVRPGPSTPRASMPSQKPTRGTGVPSGRAGRYFARSARDPGAVSQYYGRKDSYFPSGR